MKRKRGTGRRSSQSLPQLPPGIRVLIAYTGIIALLYLIYLLFGLSQPISVLFGKFIYGTGATIVEIVSLGLLISIIYGLFKRHFWVFYVSLIWFIFGALNAIVSLTAFQNEFDVLRSVLLISSLVVVVLNGIIASYIYSEKKYFKTKHLNKETRAKDKFFVYIISTFIIVSLLLLVTYGISFYTETIQTTNKVIAELEDTPNPELLCAQKAVPEQDICYLVLTILENRPHLCENINSDFYKITCYRALE